MNNLHNPPVQWGYTPTPTPANSWTQQRTRSLKRTISESDCDDIYSEGSSKDQTSPGDSSNSCQLLSRKKRRGVIEKKRRDRINSSLTELKRLVPSAYEKQGSAKLEKAEILQLTVEHLKNLHTKGIDSVSYDPQRFAMDYHIIGFRECAAEVARYLVSMEGMDIQDPLRLRLMSHLQYFVQQRELSAKTSSSSPWSTSGAYQPNYNPSTYQPYSIVPPTTTNNNLYGTNVPIANHVTYSGSHERTDETPTEASALMSISDARQIQHSQQQQPQQQQQQQSSPDHHQIQHYAAADNEHQNVSTYIELTSNNVRNESAPASITYHNSQYTQNNGQDYNTDGNVNYNVVATNNTKPYRPWGAEMAY